MSYHHHFKHHFIADSCLLNTLHIICLYSLLSSLLKPAFLPLLPFETFRPEPSYSLHQSAINTIEYGIHDLERCQVDGYGSWQSANTMCTVLGTIPISYRTFSPPAGAAPPAGGAPGGAAPEAGAAPPVGGSFFFPPQPRACSTVMSTVVGWILYMVQYRDHKLTIRVATGREETSRREIISDDCLERDTR